MLCAGDLVTEAIVEDIMMFAEDVAAHLRAMPPLCTPDQFSMIRAWVWKKVALLEDHITVGLEHRGVNADFDRRVQRDERVVKMMKDNPPPAFHRAA